MYGSYSLLRVTMLFAIKFKIYLYRDNGSALLNEHTHIPGLAPVIVAMEMVPKHKMRFYYWGSIVTQMNFNEIVTAKKEFYGGF